MTHALIQALTPDNPLPLYVVIVADWYDTKPTIKDETIPLVIREDKNPKMPSVMAALLSMRDDYDWKLMTEEEEDAEIVGLVRRYEGQVRVYHHIAAAYVTTERLKAIMQAIFGAHSAL